MPARADKKETEHSTTSCQSLRDNRKVDFRRLEAMKLVVKAIDETLLPENEGSSSDIQSINGDLCHREKRNLSRNRTINVKFNQW